VIAHETVTVTPADGDHPRGGFVAIDNNDGFAAARLMVPAFRQRLREALGDDYYVVTPNRDFLVAWSKDFSNHDRFVAKAMHDAREYPYPISSRVFTVVDGELREP
jgi:uncharacterized protein YtpQ (UPF0354 family)